MIIAMSANNLEATNESVVEYYAVPLRVDGRALTRLGKLVDEFNKLDRQGNRTKIIAITREIVGLVDGNFPIGWDSYNRSPPKSFGPDDADKGLI